MSSESGVERMWFAKVENVRFPKPVELSLLSLEIHCNHDDEQ
jgi:hypothetical protein